MSTGSPPLPLAHEGIAAAAATHAGRFRRPPAPRSTPPSSPRSAPPSPPARFSAPCLYRPLATPPPWLGFRAGLRRRVSGDPGSSLLPSWPGSATPTPHLLFMSSAADADGARHGSSPSTTVAAVKGFFTEMWRTRRLELGIAIPGRCVCRRPRLHWGSAAAQSVARVAASPGGAPATALAIPAVTVAAPNVGDGESLLGFRCSLAVRRLEV